MISVVKLALAAYQAHANDGAHCHILSGALFETTRHLWTSLDFGHVWMLVLWHTIDTGKSSKLVDRFDRMKGHGWSMNMAMACHG